jgi:Leucine-rich repeat (LRR) protein
MKLSEYSLTMGLLAVVIAVGCNRQPSAAAEKPEASFAEQAALVRTGEIERIQLDNTPLTNEDLASVAGLTNLRELLIDDPHSRITAAGIQHLANLPKLTHLRIRGRMDEATLAAIAKLTTLQVLNVPQTTCDDAALRHLESLPHLEQLRFGSPHITDAGMQTLRGLKALKRLHLIDVPITDVGLAKLAEIEQLESLYIDGSAITDAGLEALFRQRPGLHVHINQDHHDRDPHAHKHP